VVVGVEPDVLVALRLQEGVAGDHVGGVGDQRPIALTEGLDVALGQRAVVDRGDVGVLGVGDVDDLQAVAIGAGEREVPGLSLTDRVVQRTRLRLDPRLGVVAAGVVQRLDLLALRQEQRGRGLLGAVVLARRLDDLAEAVGGLLADGRHPARQVQRLEPVGMGADPVHGCR
jgi:hypothetical protein